MKKIILLLSLSIILASCSGSEKDNTIKIQTETNIEKTVETNNKMNEGSTGSELNTDNNIETMNKIEEATDTSTGKTISADEVELEKEVTNLLDEFINSLDSYEK